MKATIEMLVEINTVLNKYGFDFVGHGVDIRTDRLTFSAVPSHREKPPKPHHDPYPREIRDPRKDYDPDDSDLN